METVPEINTEEEKIAPKWLATGGILAALGATTCCVLPLALTLLGVSGAWMANLRALSPYQPYFLALSGLAIGYGFIKFIGSPAKPVQKGKCALDR